MSVAVAATGIGNKAIRIAEEVERLLRISAWIRECLESELTGGLGTGGKHGIDKNTLRSWRECVVAFNALADAQIRLDKSAKAAVDRMTPAEELAAVRAYIRAMDREARYDFLYIEREWHAANTSK